MNFGFRKTGQLAYGRMYGYAVQARILFSDFERDLLAQLRIERSARKRATRRAQFGQTLSISRSLGKFTISGEVWHFSQPFEKGNTVGNLWAVSRALRKNLVLDAGFNRGLTKTSTRGEAFVGFTYLLPHRLWMGHHGFQP